MHLGLKKSSQSPKMFMKHLAMLELARPSLILKNSKYSLTSWLCPTGDSSAAPRAAFDPGRRAPRSLTPPTAAFTSIPGELGHGNSAEGS